MTDRDAPIVVKPGTVSARRSRARARRRIRRSRSRRSGRASRRPRQIVARAARADAPVYGINTGFGKLAIVSALPPDQTALLQRNLDRCRIAAASARRRREPIVAADDGAEAHLARARRLRRAPRGDRAVAGHAERGVLPVVPQQGSVGASGDLAPLAHMAAVMIGEGAGDRRRQDRAGQRGARRRRPRAADARPQGRARADQRHAVLHRLRLSGAVRAHCAWPSAALVTGALSTDAAMASTAPFAPRSRRCAAIAARSTARGSPARAARRQRHPRVASRRRRARAGSLLPALPAAGHGRGARPARARRRATLDVEANAVTDNPLVWSRPARSCPAAISTPSRWPSPPTSSRWRCARSARSAERRIAMLVDPALFRPAAVPDARARAQFRLHDRRGHGRRAGMPRTSSAPSAARSIRCRPRANQEDHVSMAAHAARRLLPTWRTISPRIIGIELLAAAQGCDFHAPLRPARRSARVIAALRAAGAAARRGPLHGAATSPGRGRAGPSRRAAGRGARRAPH